MRQIPIKPETANAFEIIDDSKALRNKVFAPTSKAPKNVPKKTDWKINRETGNTSSLLMSSASYIFILGYE